MIGPYKMVLISILSFCIILGSILFYRYVYPKKKISYFIILILFSLPPVISMFRAGVYESGDFTIHIYRTISFYSSLFEGNLLPSWAGGLNATFGYPLFIFNYPLPYYLLSFFHLLGFTFIFSMKLYLASTFILGGICMYLLGKEIFRNDIAAFTAAIFYEFAPYHLITTNFKVGIGEIATFVFIPLVFLFSQKLLKKNNLLLIALTSLSLALLIMFHVAIAFFAGILLFFYILFFYFTSHIKTSSLIIVLFSWLFAAILSLYVWLTPFFLSKYTTFALGLKNLPYFPHFFELLYAPWRMGFLFQGPQGQLSFLLGYTHIFVILATTVLLFFKSFARNKNYVLFWLLSLFVIIFLITPSSEFLWLSVPFIAETGSHRLLILAAFTSSLLAGYLSLFLVKKRFHLFLLITITILSTILNWGNRRTIPTINDQVLIKSQWLSTAHGEGHFYANSILRDPKEPWFSALPKNHLETISGNAEIKEIKRASTYHTYIVSTTSSTLLKDNTLFFPGWEVKSDGKIIPIHHNKESVITFTLPKGLHYIEVSYQDLVVYKVLKIISIVGFILIFGCLLFYLFNKLKKHFIEEVS